MILENFGTVQFVLFATNWLALYEVCLLDTSICSSAFREEFLEGFRNQTTVLSNVIEDNAVNSSCIEWLNRRHIGVKNLYLKSWNPDTMINRNNVVSFSAFKFVEVLKCAKEMNVTDSQLNDLLKRTAETLKKLDISHSEHITSKAYKNALPHCKHLTEVSHEYCSRFDTACVETIAMKCPQITSFSLKGCDLVEYTAILKLTSECSQLKSLKVDKLKSIDDKKQHYLHTLIVQATIVNCNQLETVEFTNHKQLHDADLAKLVFPQTLKYIDFGYSAITEVTVHKLLTECPLLETLILNNLGTYPGEELFSDSYTYIMNENLKHLDIAASQVSCLGCLTIGKCFPNLTYLNVASCLFDEIDESLMNLSKYLTKLEYFNVCAVDVSLNDTADYSGLIQLINRNPYLTSLVLFQFASGGVVNAIALSVCSKVLKELIVCECVGINDACIELLANKCRELTCLDLMGTEVTDLSMTYLANNCKELTYLGIYETKVTHFGLIEIRAKCKNLTKVDYFKDD